MDFSFLSKYDTLFLQSLIKKKGAAFERRYCTFAQGRTAAYLLVQKKQKSSALAAG